MMETGQSPQNVDRAESRNRDEISIYELQQELGRIDVEIDNLRARLDTESLTDADRCFVQESLDFQIALWLDTDQYITLRRHELI